MKVLKFGGTSVGSIESLHQVRDILVESPERKIVVCSAMSGVTNQLVAIVEHMKIKEVKIVEEHLYHLETKHFDVVDELIKDENQRETLKQRIKEIIQEIAALSSVAYSETVKSKITTKGEALLTEIFSVFLNNNGVSNTLLYAEDFMHVDSAETPNIAKVSERLVTVLDSAPQNDVYITQGFICRDSSGEISDLKRGGSDFSATIIGAALDVEEVEIWTDIDGVHNNDPRYVSETYSIPYLSYSEASKLAHYGAKVLHPKTVLPLTDKEIPVILKNTFSPNAFGTVISSKVHSRGAKAISAKDNVTILKIESNTSLASHDFFKKVFDVFHKHEVVIDTVTTSEKSVSLTIDDTTRLLAITNELTGYAKVTTESLNTIICVVGESIAGDEKTYRIFNILKYIPIKMISLGKSDNNLSILIDSSYKIAALKLLQENLFLKENVLV